MNDHQAPEGFGVCGWGPLWGSLGSPQYWSSLGVHPLACTSGVPALGWEVSTAVGTGEEPAWRLTGLHFLLQTLPKTGSSPNL